MVLDINMVENSSKIIQDNLHDLVIWNRVRKGDLDALGELYELYIDVLIDFGCKNCNNKEIVLDSIHDLFVDLHRYGSRLAETDNVQYYLTGSLKRRLYKKQPKAGKIITLDPNQGVNLGDENYQLTFEEEIILEEWRKQRSSWLSWARKKLPNELEKVLELRFEKNKSYEELAEKMNISVASARTKVYRAIKALRKQRGS